MRPTGRRRSTIPSRPRTSPARTCDACTRWHTAPPPPPGGAHGTRGVHAGGMACAHPQAMRLVHAVHWRVNEGVAPVRAHGAAELAIVLPLVGEAHERVVHGAHDVLHAAVLVARGKGVWRA
eukprot:92536-Prymnesium_polylepis.2